MAWSLYGQNKKSLNKEDYDHNNMRIWGNRMSNVHNNGISFQPMDDAPCYLLYNQVAAPNEDALKLRTRTDRVL